MCQRREGDFDGPQRRRRARSADRLQRETRGDRLALIREVVQWTGQTPLGDQEGSGRARSLARARLNWFSQGQRWGRCKVRRRAELVSRPAIEKKCRRRVLVVTTCSLRPMRAVQRARLCAITPYRVRGRLWTASRAALAAKRQGCGIGVPWTS